MAKSEIKMDSVFKNQVVVFTVVVSKMYRFRMFVAVGLVKLAGFCLGAKETKVDFLKDEVRHE